MELKVLSLGLMVWAQGLCLALDSRLSGSRAISLLWTFFTRDFASVGLAVLAAYRLTSLQHRNPI